MSSAFECPYCASSENKLISSFYSAVLSAKTTVYQCEQCLNLFDLPRQIAKQELQNKLSELREDAEERTAVATAANAMGIISNPELAATIAQIQQNSLTVQLTLICQEIAIVSPTNKELLNKLNKQKTDTQLKIIEIQKQQLQNRLNDLREDVEERELQQRLSELRQDAIERISVTSGSELSLALGDESLVLVVIYARDNLGNSVPVDSYWATPSSIRSSNFELEAPTTLDTDDNSVSHLLKLLFAVFQIIFGFWLLCLAFGF
jgi:hypothetical protein